MTVQAVEAHIDSCTGVPPSRQVTNYSSQKPIANHSSTAPKAIPRPVRLPLPHYSSIKDVQLRKKLSEQGLSTGGSRPQMEKRWSEFVIANNANCDAKNPKTKSELRRQMEVWEKTPIDREGAQIKDKNFDGLAWGAKHGNDFSDLTALARSRIPKKTANAPIPQPDPPPLSLSIAQTRSNSTAANDSYISSSTPGMNLYSSPYTNDTGHVTINNFPATSDPNQNPNSILNQSPEDNTILYGTLPTQSIPPSRSFQEPSESQATDSYSLPPSSQLQQTPSTLADHNTPYG